MTDAPLSLPQLERWLAVTVADRSGFPTDEIALDRPLVDYGISSRDAVELASRLEDLLDRTLPSTLVWDHPTITQLAAALLADQPADARAAGAGDAAAGPRTGSQATPGTPPPPDAPAGAIAVIGLGARLPGEIAGPGDLWRALDAGADLVGRLPAGRWPEPASAADRRALDRTTRAGGFLRDIAGFDAEFFGISPLEARRMDPQQRILLEVAWEALEHAGLAPDALRGTPTGVYVGLSAAEYAQRSLADLATVDAWSGTGGALSIAANRLSYALDLRGPSIAVDTACSSSLVAVHLAMQSLHAGETDLALAAGTNLLLGPEVTAAFHQMGVISDRGRCQPFAATADGIVRAEGAGVVVLKRLADALRDGDRLLAVLRGSAVNQDGRSNGITAPNVDAQRDLLRAAYRDAGVDPGDVDYVEAHGTGTLLGDPIEARALGTVLGRPAGRPLLIGSVKSNFGHLEAAAGIVGLIKLVLAIDHRRIPPSLHAAEPNPHIDFDALGLAVVDRPTDWPLTDRPARAGVSAFGFGGTNAHVVVEAPPLPALPPPHDATAGRSPVRRFVLAGADATRVRETAGRLAAWLAGDGADARLADVELTLARRMSGPVRAAVLARDDDPRALVDGLRACAAGRPAPQLVDARADRAAAPPVWVFSGQGSQWAGMALDLQRDEPVFAAALHELDALLEPETGFSVCAELARRAEITPIDRLQPVLFAVQVALARLLTANGLTPAAVVGHSLGEVAAAVTTGALTPREGARVVAVRSRLLATLAANGGAMALLELSPDDLAQLVDPAGTVEIAAYNAPAQIAVAGPAAAVAALVATVDARGLLAKPIKSTVAGHCHLVDEILPELTRGLAGLRPSAPGLPCYSTALDDPRAIPAFDAAHWAANIRRPVRFAQAIAAAIADGHRAFLEVSPHPVLLHALLDNARACGLPDALVLPTGRRSADETLHLHAQLAALALAGVPGREPDRARARVIDLPTTRWRHKPHWLDAPARLTPAAPAAASGLLGARVVLPGDTRLTWQLTLEAAGAPASARGIVGLGSWLELIRSAALDAFGSAADSLRISDVVLETPLALGDRCTLTTVLDRDSRSVGRLTVHSQLPGRPWRAHVSAAVEAAAGDRPLVAPLDAASPLAAEGARAQAGDPAAVLGRAVDGLLGALDAAPDETWLVRTVGLVHWLGGTGDVAGTRTALAPPTAAGERTAAVELSDADGRIRLAVGELGLRRVARRTLPTSVPAKLRSRFWRPLDGPPPAGPAPGAPPGRWRVLADGDDPLAAELVAALAARGDHVTLDADAGGDWGGEGGGGAGEVVLLARPAPAGEPLASAAERGERLVLAAAQLAVALGRSAAGGRLRLVTTGAAAVASGDLGDPGAAALRGLVRVLAIEQPDLRPAWIDLDPTDRLAGLLAELAVDDDEDEVAWRADQRHVGRLVDGDPAARGATAGAPPATTVRPDGAYVVTGGLGRTGQLVTSWLAARGAARVVVCDRRARGPADDADLDALRGGGCEIVLVDGDISRPGVAERAIAAAAAPGARLSGVAHAAGILAERDIVRLDAASLRHVWAAKALGGARLAAATAGCELDWWVGFSSTPALVGWPGAAAAAAAAGFVGALVDRRRADGRPAAQIHWSVRDPLDAGAPGLHPLHADAPRLDPVGAITSGEAADALEALLSCTLACSGVVRLEAGELAAALPRLTEIPLFAELVDGGRGPGGRGRPGGGPPREENADTPSEKLVERVHQLIGGVLGVDPGRLSRSTALAASGVDSLLAVRIRNALQHDFGVALSPGLLLGGATIDDVVHQLCDDLDLPRPATGRPARVGPRDGTERIVAAVWREVLGREDFGVTDDFAGLGGDRRAALRATELLAERTGQPLDADDVFAGAPTIERQARRLRDAGDDAQGPLRLLRDGVAPTPLFVFHPAGGDTLVYRQLVDHLDPSLTVWGCDRFDGALTVEQRAARYVELLTDLQPTGPYLLAGWSFGGVLAYETAQLLRAAGERVDLLALIDTILPLPDPPGLSDGQVVELRFRRFADFLEASYGKPVALPHDLMAGLDDDAQTDIVIDAIVAAGLIDPDTNEAIIRHQRTSYLDVRAVERYRPAPYDGPVVFYSPIDLQTAGMRDPRFDRRDPARGWEAFCGERLDVVNIPGHHLSLLDPPHVDALADHLDGLLAAYRLSVA